MHQVLKGESEKPKVNHINANKVRSTELTLRTTKLLFKYNSSGNLTKMRFLLKYIKSIIFWSLIFSYSLKMTGQNIWKLYGDGTIVQTRNYTSKGDLKYLVQYDDDGNIVDSVAWKNKIQVYSLENNIYHINSDLLEHDFYSKFKISKETFLSPYVKSNYLIEEYVSDLQDIYDALLPNGTFVKNHMLIEKNAKGVKFFFKHLNCGFRIYFTPVILQSYMFYAKIRSVKINIENRRIRQIEYFLDKMVVNIMFSYSQDSTSIRITSLPHKGKEDIYIYKWKRLKYTKNSDTG